MACFTGVDGAEGVLSLDADPSRGGVSSCSSEQQAPTVSSLVSVGLLVFLAGGILVVNTALVRPSCISVVVRPLAERGGDEVQCLKTTMTFEPSQALAFLNDDVMYTHT